MLLVSHDRDFLDRVASVTVAMEGGGKATVFAGGWSDMQAQRQVMDKSETGEKTKPKKEKVKSEAAPRKGLSFTEKHRLEALPGEIERLEAEIGKLAGLLSDADLYARQPVKFAKASEALAERQEKLSAAEEEWLTLEEKAGG